VPPGPTWYAPLLFRPQLFLRGVRLLFGDHAMFFRRADFFPSLGARARAREVTGNQRPWPADKVERWQIDRLIPYAKNARTHTDAQVAAIAASIREWGWTSPALVGEDGGLIAGHARILAARQLGIAEVPVMVAAGWSEAQKRAYVLADNQLAITGSGWDPELLRLELGELKLSPQRRRCRPSSHKSPGTDTGSAGAGGASSGSVRPSVRSAIKSLSSRSPNPVSDKSKPLSTRSTFVATVPASSRT
jgi:hypothetical protein